MYKFCGPRLHKKHTIAAAQLAAIHGQVSIDRDLRNGGWTHASAPVGR